MESTFERSRSGFYIPKKLGKLLSNFSAFRRLGDPLFNRIGARGLPWGFGPRVGGAVFSPSDVSGLILWLKADAIEGLNNNDPVATWADVSGQSNDLAQGVAAKRPLYITGVLNGLPIVRFDRVDDYLISAVLAVSVTQPYVGFLVSKSTRGFVDASERVFSSRSPADVNAEGFLIYHRQSVVDEYAVFAGLEIGQGVMDVSFHIQGGLFNGAASYGRLDGANEAGNVSTNDADRFGLGARIDDDQVGGNLFGGDIAEVLLYDNEISLADRDAVEIYLSNKYSIALA